MATAKLLAEKDNPQADVVQGLAASSLLLMKGEGMIESHAPKGVERLDPRFVDQSDPPAWVGLDVWAASVGVSTVELEQAGLAMPTSWEDLTRPDCPVLALMISSTNALVRIGHGLVVDRMIRAQRWRRR